MIVEVIFGVYGYCENCDETHDHPLNNIIETVDDNGVSQIFEK